MTAYCIRCNTFLIQAFDQPLKIVYSWESVSEIQSSKQVLVAGLLIHPQILDGCLCCAALPTIDCQSHQDPWEPQHSSSVLGGMCSSASWCVTYSRTLWSLHTSTNSCYSMAPNGLKSDLMSFTWWFYAEVAFLKQKGIVLPQVWSQCWWASIVTSETTGQDSIVSGYVGATRLAWKVLWC